MNQVLKLPFCFMKNSYPGGPLLNPLGLAKDIKNAHDWKLKEIKNGLASLLSSWLTINLTSF